MSNIPKSLPAPIDWDAIRDTLREIDALLSDTEASPEVRQSVLQRRAQLAAETPVAQDLAPRTALPVLTFRQGRETYAVPVASVRAIAPLQRLTPVPCVPAYYRGVANLSGRIVSVLDLQRLFGIAPQNLPQPPADNATPMLIVVTGAGLEMALVADSVQAVTSLAAETLTAAQATGDEAIKGIAGVTAEGIVVLDMNGLLRDPRLWVDEEPA
jgi:purine-binding chemotaxis protein CheW